MHIEQKDFFSKALNALRPAEWRGDEKVIEIGSFDVNGSIRDLFDVTCGGQYVGVDLLEGPNVDIVSSGDTVDYPNDSFDLAVSGECFEHNPQWLETFVNMHRMTCPAAR